MTTVELNGLTRARVWRDELPCDFVPVGSVERTIRAEGPVLKPGRVAVEIAWPRGGVTMYGLLGVAFTPSVGSADLLVRVDHSGDALGSGQVFESPILPGYERAFTGLPLEFADAVIAGVNEALVMGVDCGPGELRFDHAAHGVVGSSEAMFSVLATAAVRLLVASTGDVDLADVLRPVLT